MGPLLFSEMLDHGRKKEFQPQSIVHYLLKTLEIILEAINLVLVIICACTQVVHILSQGKASGKAVAQCKKWRYSIKLLSFYELDVKIFCLFLNYEEVVASNLLFLLDDVCFEVCLLFVLARQPGAIVADPSKTFSQLPLTPQPASMSLSASLWIG